MIDKASPAMKKLQSIVIEALDDLTVNQKLNLDFRKKKHENTRWINANFNGG